jgi:hypothetical protein
MGKHEATREIKGKNDMAIDVQEAARKIDTALDNIADELLDEGFYMPAFITLIRLKTDELAETFPSEINDT